MNPEEQGPTAAERGIPQPGTEGAKAKFQGMLDKAQAGTRSENPHKKSPESRDTRIGQLRVMIEDARQQIEGFQELLDHRDEPDYVLQKSPGRSKVGQHQPTEGHIRRQIDLQERHVADLESQIRDLQQKKT